MGELRPRLPDARRRLSSARVTHRGEALVDVLQALGELLRLQM